MYSASNNGTKDRGIFEIFKEEYRNLRPRGKNAGCTANNVPNDNPFTVSSFIIYKVRVTFIGLVCMYVLHCI